MCRICFPRLYAAASLKQGQWREGRPRWTPFSAALCRGFIEASEWECPDAWLMREFSAALCRGFIEAASSRQKPANLWRRFPRLYAAASLKRALRATSDECFHEFSAALCRGFIEAQANSPVGTLTGRAVFRGFMPRLH